MSANLTEGAAADGAQASASFNVQKIYLKDVSFEAPNAPMVFNEQGQPDGDESRQEQVVRAGQWLGCGRI